MSEIAISDDSCVHVSIWVLCNKFVFSLIIGVSKFISISRFNLGSAISVCQFNVVVVALIEGFANSRCQYQFSFQLGSSIEVS